jgi:hypothetical protein
LFECVEATVLHIAHATVIATSLALATTTATATATGNATTTATKVEGNVWMTWQLLAAAGEDGWWRRIFSSLSA